MYVCVCVNYNVHNGYCESPRLSDSISFNSGKKIA